MTTPPRTRTRPTEGQPAPTAGRKGPPVLAPGAVSVFGMMDEANKRYGAGALVPSAAMHQHMTSIPLGHMIGDLALLGGIPEGQSAMFIGKEGGGKTTQALRCVAAAQRKYPDHKVLWVDTEQTLDPIWAEHHGVDMDRLLISQPPGGEDAVDLIKTVCESAEDVCMVVMDSVNQLTPMKEYEESVGDAQVALQARLMGRLCSRLTTAGSYRKGKRWVPVTRIFTNQWRFKIGVGPRQDPRTLPGGMQFLYHCSTHLEFKSKIETDKDDEAVEATSVVEHTLNVRRTKTAASIRTGEYRVVVGPDMGLPIGTFDEAGTILTFAKKMDMWGGGGTNQGFQNTPPEFSAPRFRKMEEGREWLEQNPDMALELKRAIIMHRRERVGLPALPSDGYLLRW